MRLLVLKTLFCCGVCFCIIPYMAHAAGSVSLVHSNKDTVVYTATTTSDVGNGTALLTAVNAAQHGDSLYLSADTFDIGNNNIDLSKGDTMSISIHGSGKYSTVIKSSYGSNNIISAASYSETTDLSIIASSPAFVGTWGKFGGTGFTNAILKNVYMSGNTDAILIGATTPVTAVVTNITAETKWDTLNFIAPGGTMYVFDSTLTAAATLVPANGQIGQYARAVACSGRDAKMYIYNSTLTASGGTLYNRTVHTNAFYPLTGDAINLGTGSEIYLYGGTISSSGTAARDIFVTPWSTVGVDNQVSYDTNKTTADGTLVRLENTYAHRMSGTSDPLATITIGSYNFPPGGTDEFRIFPFRNSAEGKIFGVPVLTGIGDQDDSFKIDMSWNPVSAADGYRIVEGTANYFGALYSYYDTAAASLTLGTGVENSFVPATSFPATTSPYYKAYPTNQSLVIAEPSATVTSSTTVTLNGSITANGGVSAFARGFTYGMNSTYGPSVGEDGSFGTGSFSQSLTELLPGTTYSYRAYAVNSSGIATSSSVTFTTTDIPEVSLSDPSSVAATSVILNANMISDEGASSTARGFHWGSSTSYGTVTTENGTFGNGAFSVTLSGLSCGTTYHYKAYSTNSAGTGYASDSNFTTSVCPTSGGGSSSSGGSSVILPTPTSFVSMGTTTGTEKTALYLNTDLKLGDVGPDVRELQKFLNIHGMRVAYQGIGSPGFESTVFGPMTQNALVRFQQLKHIPLTGRLDLQTRAAIHSHSGALSQEFAQDLALGSLGADVKKLQIILNSLGFLVAGVGLGSPGNESEYFGKMTKNAVMNFQRSQYLPATGYVGPLTRAVLNGIQ